MIVKLFQVKRGGMKKQKMTVVGKKATIHSFASFLPPSSIASEAQQSRK
jgi:hypothetical protein